MSRLILCALVLSSVALSQRTPVSGTDRPESLVDLLAEDGRFATLLALAEQAGLAETLRGDGLTLFAPTDAAFGKLPPSVTAYLTSPAGRRDLSSILRHHVVMSRADAVAAVKAEVVRTAQGTLIGIAIRNGRLTVQGVNVTENDLAARSGVVHVVDAVLLPPGLPRTPATRGRELLQFAVENGAPLYNDGQIEACAVIYETTVRALVDFAEELPDAATDPLREALKKASDQDARDRAWTLRAGIDAAWAALESGTTELSTERSKSNDVAMSLPDQLRAALDASPDDLRATVTRVAGALDAPRSAARLRRALEGDEATLRRAVRAVHGDLAFEPSRDAPVPEGWPTPTRVNEVEVKRYPRYRMARTNMGRRQTGNSSVAFWKLFAHIKSNDIAMTAPVQMDYPSTEGERATMAFLYANDAMGKAKDKGPVAVVDIEPATYLSIGLRGVPNDARIEEARAALDAWLNSHEDWSARGGFRTMGWNGPMTPEAERFWEVQIRIEKS